MATQRHLELYNKIAERNSNPDYTSNVGHPKETAAVGMKCFNLSLLQLCSCINNDSLTFWIIYSLTAYAKQKHLTLFEKIAAEHARIGEEQLAQRLAFEATSIRYEEEEH